MGRDPTAYACALLALLSAGCKGGAGIDGPGAGEPDREVEHCGAVTDEQTWRAELRHLLTCDVEIRGELTVEPGAEIYAVAGVALRVDGGLLTALGTSDDHILMASDDAFPTAGDWVGLVSDDGQLELGWLTVRHGGSQGGIIDLTGGLATLDTVLVSNGLSYGIRASDTVIPQADELEISYVPEPLSLPWTATAALDEIFLDSVDVEAVSLPETTLSAYSTLPALDLPFQSPGVTLAEDGVLEMLGGATLQLGGDLRVTQGALMIEGTSSDPALIVSDIGATLEISSQALIADIEGLSSSGLSLVSDAPHLMLVDSQILDAPGAAVTITGSVQDRDPDLLSGNSLGGEGPGLVVPFTRLGQVGDNDYSAASFDGLAVGATEIGSDLEYSGFPTERLLVVGDLDIQGGTTTLSGAGDLVFDDDTYLRVGGGELQATGMSFTHVDQEPGGWQGIILSEDADTTLIDSCEIGHGGAEGGANIWVAAPATIRDSEIHSSAGWGVLVVGEVEPNLEGNVYRDNAGGDVGP